MKILTLPEISHISGGEFVQGFPTPEMLCLNMKVMISAGRGEPGFDITAGVRALMKYCNGDFWDLNTAHEFVTSGGIP